MFGAHVSEIHWGHNWSVAAEIGERSLLGEHGQTANLKKVIEKLGFIQLQTSAHEQVVLGHLDVHVQKNDNM